MTESNATPVYRITDLHESDRPRQRLAALGPQALRRRRTARYSYTRGCPWRERRPGGAAPAK